MPRTLLRLFGLRRRTIVRPYFCLDEIKSESQKDDFMETLILVVHFIVALFLIGTILLQSGKGADIGAAFGAGSSQTVFGPRGATTILHKMTVAAAAIFLMTSFSLTYMSRQDKGSVLDDVDISEEVLIPDLNKDDGSSEEPQAE
jgi:preprotein translocase subunit SecG